VITFLKVKAIFSKFHLYISIKNQNSEKKVSKALHAFETFFNGLKITKLQGYKVTKLQGCYVLTSQFLMKIAVSTRNNLVTL
jgi:hypothetical protein